MGVSSCFLLSACAAICWHTLERTLSRSSSIRRRMSDRDTCVMLNILSSGPRSRMLEISFDNVPCSSLFNGVKEGGNEARFKYSF